MNKLELANKIKQIDGLTQDEKNELLNILHSQKKYGLVWEDKPEQVEQILTEKLPVLTEIEELRIIANTNLSDFKNLTGLKDQTSLFSEHEINPENQNKNPENPAPNHILIEGDNLHALTTLTFTHEGKIDVIYIDPPYNTGNKDFIYNDKFVDKEDSYRHSKWLSFMHKRLKIAKRLLNEKGVIFISIDDNEQAQLKLLCDEIFGEENFITKIIWQKKTGSSDAKTIDTITEYIYVITKTLDFQNLIFKRNTESHDLKRYRFQDEFFEERGPYYLDTLDRGGLRYSDSLNYGIECPDKNLCFPNGRDEFINDGWTWKWGKTKLKWGIENKFIDFKKNPKKKSGWNVYYKNYLNVDNENNTLIRSAPLKNMIIDIKNADGASDIKEIFEFQVFKYTKPTKLIIRILEYIFKKNILILDFFAGSGTTLHATMQLNDEDGGNRQCILVTNNENNIARDVCYERNKRVIQGYTNSKGEFVNGLQNNNLRYYRADFVDREQTFKTNLK
jgi:adenine-specific DNA-methyltransferase